MAFLVEWVHAGIIVRFSFLCIAVHVSLGRRLIRLGAYKPKLLIFTRAIDPNGYHCSYTANPQIAKP